MRLPLGLHVSLALCCMHATAGADFQTLLCMHELNRVTVRNAHRVQGAAHSPPR